MKSYLFLLMVFLSVGFARAEGPPPEIVYPPLKENFIERMRPVLYADIALETGIYYFGKKIPLTINGKSTGKTLKEVFQGILAERKESHFVSTRGLLYYFIHGHNQCFVQPVNYDIECVKIGKQEQK